MLATSIREGFADKETGLLVSRDMETDGMLILHVDRAEEIQLFKLDVRFEVCVVLVHRIWTLLLGPG